MIVFTGSIRHAEMADTFRLLSSVLMAIQLGYIHNLEFPNTENP